MYYGYGYGFDWTYILLIIGVVISGIASMKVNSTFKKYAKIGSTSGMTGAEAAQKILYSEGIMDVRIQHVAGNLTDHYNPATKTVNLSDATYASSSVAAVGVAAHECGHVIQHHRGYAPLNIRTALVPVANIGSRAGIPIILIGMFLGANQALINLGILVFSFGVLFQIVTLPVEFDASARALRLVGTLGILNPDEVKDTRKVLKAAAMTYVASAFAAMLSLLRLLILFGGNRRRN
ncbi:MAG: zinc metallopeptidase [Lachnospiraceae bacterium]|nr:zinc metallopeptidase [Lachnospiraceae bacterium]